MRNIPCKSICIMTALAFSGAMLGAQGLLTNDTLYIGSATVTADEHFVLPVYIKTTQDYQGWQIPIRFGDGTTPVHCDSVTTTGTVMESWAFQAPFINNNQWNNVQACGIAGIIDWTGGSIVPGYYLVMNVHFTVNSSPVIGSYSIDTTRASWYAGGPQNAYVVTVGGSSYITNVVQGAITVVPVGIEEHYDKHAQVSLDVYPTMLTAGQELSVRYSTPNGAGQVIVVYDGCGRAVDSFTCSGEGQARYATSHLTSGVYFITAGDGDGTTARKIVIR